MRSNKQNITIWFYFNKGNFVGNMRVFLFLLLQFSFKTLKDFIFGFTTTITSSIKFWLKILFSKITPSKQAFSFSLQCTLKSNFSLDNTVNLTFSWRRTSVQLYSKSSLKCLYEGGRDTTNYLAFSLSTISTSKFSKSRRICLNSSRWVWIGVPSSFSHVRCIKTLFNWDEFYRQDF